MRPECIADFIEDPVDIQKAGRIMNVSNLTINQVNLWIKKLPGSIFYGCPESTIAENLTKE